MSSIIFLGGANWISPGEGAHAKAAAADGVSPGLGIEYYDRDKLHAYPKLKYSNDSYHEASFHPHTYPQLILAK